jgi:tyrosine-specific transport protein
MRFFRLPLIASLPYYVLLGMQCTDARIAAFSSPNQPSSLFSKHKTPSSLEQHSTLILRMKKDDPRRLGNPDDTPSVLSVASISDGFSSSESLKDRIDDRLNSLSESCQSFIPVVSSALLITSSAVGASMMVLPDLARGPGLVVSSGLIGAIYIINLVSGLLIAEVAINQYERSMCEVPSSFKEFADVNLQSGNAGNFVSAISLFSNTCVLTFDFVRAGELSTSAITNEAMLPVFGNEIMENISYIVSSGHAGIMAVAAFFVILVSTQSDKTLTGIASMCCLILFASFAGLVVPSVAMIQDPIATFTASGSSAFGSEAFFHDISSMAPVVLSAMIYQNIVPTITKMLNYDRQKTVTAIALGSSLPMIIYIAFCYCIIGGGAVTGAETGGIFLNGLMASSVFGSAMACLLSIGEELECILSVPKDEACGVEKESLRIEPSKADNRESFVPYALGATLPVLIGVFFSGGNGFVGALQANGSYGCPLLYGVIPVVLAFSQRTQILDELKGNAITENIQAVIGRFLSNATERENELVPGGMAPLGALSVAAGALISTHLVEDGSAILHFFK